MVSAGQNLAEFCTKGHLPISSEEYEILILVIDVQALREGWSRAAHGSQEPKKDKWLLPKHIACKYVCRGNLVEKIGRISDSKRMGVRRISK
jgi:hypothetical protein